MKPGEGVSRVMGDTQGVRAALGSAAAQLATSGVTALIAAVGLALISPVLFAAVLPFLLMVGVASHKSTSALRSAVAERRVLSAEVSGSLTETLTGIRTVKICRAEARAAALFAEGVGRLLRNTARSVRISALMRSSTQLAVGLAGVAATVIGSLEVLHGELSVGAFVTFLLFLGYVMGPTTQAVGACATVAQALACLDRVREVTHQKLEGGSSRGSRLATHVAGEVVFDSVSFAYQGGKPVLRGVSFRARAGSVNVIRGPSGSGKSTIGALIAGLYLPSRGRVLIVVERGISGLTRGRTLFLIIHHDSAVAPVDQTQTIGRGRVRPESGLAVGPVRSAHHQEASCPASGAVSPLAGEAVGGAAAG